MLALGAVLGLAVFVAMVVRPTFGAYTYILVGPLVTGMARGDLLPFVRPNEALFLVIVTAIGVRAVLDYLSRRSPFPTLNAVDLGLLFMAVASSIIPILWKQARGLALTSDDIMYSLVLWKYLLLYMAFRVTIRTTAQVHRCLTLSMVSAAVVALVGMLQVSNLFGVPEFLHTHYDQPFEGHKDVLTERGTSTVASSFSFGDMMIMNFAIAYTMLQHKRRGRWLLMGAAAMFLGGCIAAGAFSGYIGLVVAVVALGVITGQLVRLIGFGIPAGVVASILFLPVIAGRLEGFESPAGVPHSWRGRWINLEQEFFPQLFSGFNWLLGVQPAPRLPAPETWRDFIYIESGYVWLLWIGGIPFLAAFVFFVWVAAKRLWRTVHERDDAIAVAATASLTSFSFIVVLMLLDPHLTARGAADLFYVLLALALVRPREARRPQRVAQEPRRVPAAVPATPALARRSRPV